MALLDWARMQRGQPPKRKQPLRRKKPLKRMSNAKREEWMLRKREEVMREVYRRDRGCIWFKVGGDPTIKCWGGLDVHEPLPRSRGGDPLDPAQCVLLCRGHHRWVHDHPAAGKALGLLYAGYQWPVGQMPDGR